MNVLFGRYNRLKNCITEQDKRMPRGISWSFNETEALIRLWADSTTQTALRLNSRNRCIYEDIANQLQAIGIIRTADRMLK